MDSFTPKSDIEVLLEDQSWKRKKLPPIIISKNTGKYMSSSSSNILSKTSIKTSAHSAKIIPIQSDDNLAETCEDEINRALSNLDLIFDSEVSIKSTIPTRIPSQDFQVPIFPKRHFGTSGKPLNTVPKFEIIKSLSPIEVANDVKIKNGRIQKRYKKNSAQQFEYLNNYKKLKRELPSNN